jgi:hypothetical protein
MALNNHLVRNFILFLIIGGTLVSSLTVTGQVYASSKEQLDTDVGSAAELTDEQAPTEEEGETVDQATDEDDNETGSARQTGGSGEFCLEGTGGTTGRPCIPCDPTQPTPGMGTNCPIISDGGAIMQKNETEPKSKGKGEIISPAIIEDLLSPDNPAGKAKITFGILEEQGKVPPNTTETIDSLLTGDTEESTKAFGKLCDIVSADKSSEVGAIDCSVFEVSGEQPTNTTTVATCAICVEAFKQFLEWAIKNGALDAAPGVDEATQYCQQNPAACK